jgi:SPP1 family predicted phage head-tail adaptor
VVSQREGHVSKSRFTPVGEMRRLIRIQTISTAPTASGQTTGDEADYIEAWARIEPMSQREIWLARAQQDLSTHKINMLYRDGITPKMQAIYDGRVFNFTGVTDLMEMHRELEIMAIEPVNTDAT